MISVYLYQARRPFLPLLAGALHLELTRMDNFMAAGLRHDWQAAPLFIAGPDRRGEMVCCLACGSRPGLYKRALEGLSGLFAINLVHLDMDNAVSGFTFADKAQANLASWVPLGYGCYHQDALAALIRPLVINHGGM